MIKFKTGKKYFHSFVTDSSCIVTYEVISMTAKMLTVQNTHTKELIKKKIGEFDNQEIIYPLGKYSMCPTLRATKEVKEC